MAIVRAVSGRLGYCCCPKSKDEGKIHALGFVISNSLKGDADMKQYGIQQKLEPELY